MPVVLRRSAPLSAALHTSAVEKLGIVVTTFLQALTPFHTMPLAWQLSVLDSSALMAASWVDMALFDVASAALRVLAAAMTGLVLVVNAVCNAPTDTTLALDDVDTAVCSVFWVATLVLVDVESVVMARLLATMAELLVADSEAVLALIVETPADVLVDRVAVAVVSAVMLVPTEVESEAVAALVLETLVLAAVDTAALAALVEVPSEAVLVETVPRPAATHTECQ